MFVLRQKLLMYVDLSCLIACSTGREIPIDDAGEADMEFEALSNKNIWNL